MEQLLVRYLWITGIGAAIVLAMPWLVLIGLYAFILPGIVLGLLPSAFLYGAAFALSWFPLHRVIGDGPAALVAAAVTLGVAWTLPVRGNAVTRARYLAERADDVLPPTAIALRGDVLLVDRSLTPQGDRSPRRHELPPPDYAKERCSPLCAALLFTDGVTSVTTQYETTDVRGAQPVSRGAVTFRLVPRDRCTSTIEPSFTNGPFGDGGLRALADEWKLRLSTTDCIVAGPPVAAADFAIVASRFTSPLPAPTRPSRARRGSRWSLAPRSVGVERLELFDGAGRVLLRHTVARAGRIVQPLLVVPEGADNFRFHLASAPLGRKREEFQPVALLAAHTTLVAQPGADARGDGADLADRVRARLAELVDDPAVPAIDPGFGLVERFLEAMGKAGAPPADVALLRRLIDDDRVTNFGRIWDAARALGPRLEELRGPIVARLRRADPAREASLHSLGDVLAELPAGAFATVRPDEAELIADVDRHRFAGAIIARQADRGAAAVPLLTHVLDVQVRRLAALRADGPAHAHLPEKESARVAIGAVRVALCRLGPAASGALPAIEALERDGLLERIADDRSWHVMLARLGRPVEAIPKPRNLSGSEARFHDDLRRRLARFDPARHCER